MPPPWVLVLALCSSFSLPQVHTFHDHFYTEDYVIWSQSSPPTSVVPHSTWMPKGLPLPQTQQVQGRLTIHNRSSLNIPTSIVDATILPGHQVRDVGSPMTTTVLHPISHLVLPSFLNIFLPLHSFFYHIMHRLPHLPKPPSWPSPR